ncbi:MAG: threonine synthase, partial [Candidatus Krumholzibacteria bacterium]|nr:threonine synthase [Candidatus Krumholzibacteria bacterium]
MYRRYKDTRGFDDSEPVFTDIILAGIAGGGGLYVPASLPSLPADEILDLGDLTYPHLAADLFQLFGVDIEYDRVKVLMDSAYGDNFDTPSIAPVTEAAPGMYLLELWHGPTSAFKDMALQCMSLFFCEAAARKRRSGDLQEDYLILVATSGDTGKAALEGFTGRDHVRIAVFYPFEGVSDIQRKQMVTQEGDNVVAFGVEGDFDDCQDAVKAVFNDAAFNRDLRKRYRLRLSSANS